MSKKCLQGRLDRQFTEQAEALLVVAISSLPVQKMSKKDMKAWLEEDEY